MLLKWWRPFKHLETRASPLHDVGRTLPSQRAGAKSPTRVITRFCKLIQNTIFPEERLNLLWITIGSAARIVSWSGLIQRSWRSTRSYSLELAMKAAIAAIWGMLHLHSFCNKNTPLMFDKNLKDTLSVLSLVPREAGAPHTLSDKSLRVNFYFSRIFTQ